MTEASAYHRPGTDPSEYGDEGSDSDLDLGELDPQASGARLAAPLSGQRNKKSLEIRSHIPLRSLRFSGRRDYRRATGGGDGDNDEDLEALVSKPQALPDSHTRQNDDFHSFSARPPPSAAKDLLSRIRSFVSPKQYAAQLPEVAEGDDVEEHDATSDRSINVGLRQDHRFPSNAVSNAKYTPVSFLPRTLYNEFSFFFNLYFLLVALSQIIKPLRIGLLSTYVAPLVFVLAITLGKEALDDIARRRRDNEANSELYTVLRVEDIAGSRSSNFSRSGILRKHRRLTNGSGTASTKTANETLSDSDFIDHRRILKTSKDLKVGDILVMEKNERFPADVVILKSFTQESKGSDTRQAGSVGKSEGSEANLIDSDLGPAKVDGKLVNETTSSDPSAGGEAFIRTDQLDGETDWKLRLAASLAQTLPVECFTRLRIVAGKPDRKVNEFVGTLELIPAAKQQYDPHVTRSDDFDEHVESDNAQSQSNSQPLSIDNTAWANTVLASTSTVLAVVIYTGPQTRAALSTSPSRSKTGLLEYEINSLTKILCFLTLALSFALVAVQGFHPYGGMLWYVAVMRFLILFSTIVPISLRVNLDMGKSVYAWFIQRDTGIPETVVRTSTIPEDLGRIEYLLSDKTGTLTQNEMELKKVHIGTVSYANEAMDEVAAFVKQAFGLPSGSGQATRKFFNPSTAINAGPTGGTRTRREIGSRVRDLVLALALCHNVTPTQEEIDGKMATSYQASSPDEIAIVRWTEQVGLRLLHRDRKTITLQFAEEEQTVVRVSILNIFPFTSDSKRMGIIVQFHTTDHADGDIVFFQKGADTVMTSIVAANDWLDEETGNMAREGLRTLVIGRRSLSQQQYASFVADFSSASLSLSNRDASMARIVAQHLEHDLELIGVTGVEDKLQAQIKPSLELLRNAGIKIWMLTGDKIETARCVAISSKLVARGQYIHTISSLKRRDAALEALSVLHSQPSACLLIDGQSLSVYLDYHREAFISLAVKLPTVIACRCSPTQKASLALLIRSHTGKRTACIGDGGNDVSMIQAADVGVGIVGKEGRQASLAADFSITQFAHLTKLLVWHGRNSYKRSAKLAQFVIHRGLIAAVCQTVFSIAAHFEPHALYRDWLLVGYATVYTMAPVFSLVLDRDVDENLANLYPELYKELTPGHALSYRSFFAWVAISVYQGLVIQGGAQVLVPSYFADLPDPNVPDKDLTAFKQMVSISYTSLVVNELVMVAAEITTWHPVMIFSIVGTAAVFFGSLPLLGGYFDLAYLVTIGFWWRTVAIAAVSLVPVWGGKCIRRRVKPPNYRKVQGI